MLLEHLADAIVILRGGMKRDQQDQSAFGVTPDSRAQTVAAR